MPDHEEELPPMEIAHAKGTRDALMFLGYTAVVLIALFGLGAWVVFV